MHELGDLSTIFTSEALAPYDARVHEVAGREELGRLFEFRVRFSVETDALPDEDLDALLERPCSIRLGAGEDDVIHGIVSEVEVVESLEGRRAVYVATVVPAVWLLTLSRVSRVFQNMTVADMAKDILTRAGFGEKDVVFRLFAKPEKREFCVQYEESDWDFLQRWFEHEGYFYWFEHHADGERLIIGDVNDATPDLPGDAQLRYHELAGMVRPWEVVYAWTSARKRTPRRVVLKDYNELNPGLPMVGQADIGTRNGFGVLFAYGEHFDNPEAGKRLAKKRAERCKVEHSLFRGRTDCMRVRVGHRFELVDHFKSENNRTYVLTAVEHYLGRLPPADLPESSMEREDYGYRGTIEAVPFDVQYRSARTTPWPRIDGVIHAHVDSDTEGKFSTLNGQGRYRVRLPFDSTGKCGEHASNWVRMAQSYAGAGYGSHFPLHKGTEVLLAFVDGDPDRPMIVGAVANAQTPSPSATRNATQSVIRSASGIQFSMEDFHAPPSSRVPH
jgi:type VI secretion system secreted protein VgrG